MHSQALGAEREDALSGWRGDASPVACVRVEQRGRGVHPSVNQAANGSELNK